MKTSVLPLVLIMLLAGSGVAFAQAPIPEPQPPASVADQPIVLSADAPLLSLEEQVRGAKFAQRAAFANAFDKADLSVDAKVAELRSRGLKFPAEAETNLATARDQGRQAYRDLSLTTNETWSTARDNAVTATRRLRGALEDLEKFSAQPQG